MWACCPSYRVVSSWLCQFVIVWDQVITNAASPEGTESRSKVDLLKILARKYDHVTPLLKELHWLPIKKHIVFEIASKVHPKQSSSVSQLSLRTLPTNLLVLACALVLITPCFTFHEHTPKLATMLSMHVLLDSRMSFHVLFYYHLHWMSSKNLSELSSLTMINNFFENCYV